MKKKLLSMMVVAAIAIVACYHVYIAKEGMGLSNLVLNNIEALADYGETNPLECYMAHCCYDPAFDCFGVSPSWRYCPDMRSY